jgi:hypothetical protein
MTLSNWVLHKIGDMNVIQRLKKIVAGAHEGTWSSLNNLPSGNALASLTHMARPVTPCLLRYTISTTRKRWLSDPSRHLDG